jgi:hypothetical protein
MTAEVVASLSPHKDGSRKLAKGVWELRRNWANDGQLTKMRESMAEIPTYFFSYK